MASPRLLVFNGMFARLLMFSPTITALSPFSFLIRGQIFIHRRPVSGCLSVGRILTFRSIQVHEGCFQPDTIFTTGTVAKETAAFQGML